MSFNKLNQLQKAIGSRVQYVDLRVTPQVGFRGVLVQSNYGDIVCLGDQNCPDAYTWGINLDSWRLISAGDPVRFINSDGLEVLRQTSADAVECRMASYSNVYCDAPGWNIVTQLSN